ncbi:MAG TPA: bifunctional oligoribonuclease/PAP phosphatase NrnA [Mycobacteriales bacterium]|nr:bifunctional oligoribonuclease/PAP phosphatase NrnA [Mycobacteriales bacterium]
MNLQWDAALAAIRQTSGVVLAGHIRPDGDALGSMLALAHALRQLRIPVSCVAEPHEVPPALSFLPGIENLIAPDELAGPAPLLIALDASSPSRLGPMTEALAGAKEALVIDHHASNTGFGTIELIDPAAAATGVLVSGLIDRLGVPLDEDIATCLYTAVVADTGAFRHSNTTPAVHELAARLLATGIEHDRIVRTLFDTHPAGWLRMLSNVLARATTERIGEIGLVWTAVTTADLRENGLSADQAESVIDVVRTNDAAEIAVVFKQASDDPVWTVSTRSRGTADVGELCVGLGGGGHRLAAGYTAHGSLDVAVDRLRAALAGE